MGYSGKRYEPAAPSMSAFRYCTNCTMDKTSLNGYYKIAENGKSRRWICKECYDKRLR